MEGPVLSKISSLTYLSVTFTSLEAQIKRGW